MVFMLYELQTDAQRQDIVKPFLLITNQATLTLSVYWRLLEVPANSLSMNSRHGHPRPGSPHVKRIGNELL
jgi:hypothetical protein